jgi:ABC-type polysaccharide/polyol phosphate transport system ATPase subunit
VSEPAIEVSSLEKTFRIPERRIDSLKERVLHPFAQPHYRSLRVLRGISFDVEQGEFFGVVGRNGSGKSTLLKILASIYRADAGRILVAGRIAPLIELGVGFNPKFSARENVILNAVMMGLSPREAQHRFDEVIDFAELHDYTDLELKNYSSGMMVRLAFAVITQVDADILLIDEVLAVGDASFQQKCADVFHGMRNSGKTVVLVTHDMPSVQAYCHRALLLDDGEIRQIGGPDEIGRAYLNLNFEHDVSGAQHPDGGSSGVEHHARLIEAQLSDSSGQSTENVERGQPIRISAVVEATRELREPVFGFSFTNADGLQVFEFHGSLPEHMEAGSVDAGQRVRVVGEVENPLTPGRYAITLWVARRDPERGASVKGLPLLDFVVYGGTRAGGLVDPPPHEVEVALGDELSVGPASDGIR